MPLSLPSAAALNVALISSTVVFLESCAVRSTIDTFGVGTRIDVPFSLPFSSGITSPIIFAAPVEEGFMLIDARAPRVLVRQVEDALVVGVAVDGGHQATLDA